MSKYLTNNFYCDILDLPDDLVNALRNGASESKILLLAKISDQEARAVYLKDLDSVTRDVLKDDVDTKSTGRAGNVKKTPVLSPEDERVVDEIQRALGLKVRMQRNGSGSEAGKVTIEFYSESDLQELFRKLVSEP